MAEINEGQGVRGLEIHYVEIGTIGVRLKETPCRVEKPTSSSSHRVIEFSNEMVR